MLTLISGSPFDLTGVETLDLTDPARLALVFGLRAGRIGLIILLSLGVLWVLRRAGRTIVSGWDKMVARESDAEARGRLQRKRTLMGVFMTTAKVVVSVTALLLCLPQVGLDYGPVLFAAGGVSLAVGFGAQSLIRDFFSGFFVLLENQYVIGDWVEINGREGTVEDINLRTTVLRGLNGDLYIIPNGEIRVVCNQTRNWSRPILDIRVAYDSDIDRVSSILRKAASEMAQDPHWRDKFKGDAVFAGVQELGENAVVVRMLLKTQPGEQWGVAREYRRRAKARLQEAGINIPLPQRVLTHRYETPEERERAQASQEPAEHESQAEAPVSPEQFDRAAAVSNAAMREEGAEATK